MFVDIQPQIDTKLSELATSQANYLSTHNKYQHIVRTSELDFDYSVTEYVCPNNAVGYQVIFYKEDQEGNQSTFNLFILPDNKQNKLFTYIDNIKLDKKVWHSNNDKIEDIIKSFNDWASGAPVLFELEAQKSLSNCLNNFMIKNEY